MYKEIELNSINAPTKETKVKSRSNIHGVFGEWPAISRIPHLRSSQDPTTYQSSGTNKSAGRA